jgi:hypothetical protein
VEGVVREITESMIVPHVFSSELAMMSGMVAMQNLVGMGDAKLVKNLWELRHLKSGKTYQAVLA